MKRKYWVGLGVVLAVVVVAGLLFYQRGKNAKAQPAGPADAFAGAPVAVLVAPAVQRDVPVYLDGLGTVAAYNTVTVRSRVDGQLIKVTFTEGQDVRQGELLAEVDPRPFEVQLRQAQALLARDLAQLAQAKVTLSRNLALRAEKLISQEQLDQQTAMVAQLEATTQGDRSAVDNAKLQLSYTRISSPLNGRTGLRLVDQGNMIHANDPNGIVVIAQLEPIAILITLPEDNLPAISREMSQHPLSIQAYSRDGSISLGQGQVSLVDNQINPTAGTIKLKAIFANPQRVLWPNQFVKGRVLVSTLKNAIVVPAPAVQRGPNGTFVFVLKDDKTVQARAIEVASSEGDTAVVSKGLQAREQVVVEGQFKLRDGSRVIPRPQPVAETSAGGQAPDASGSP
jgi:multidrug efflux system membrane fusion protein